jgi:hypothetical protein
MMMGKGLWHIFSARKSVTSVTMMFEGLWTCLRGSGKRPEGRFQSPIISVKSRVLHQNSQDDYVYESEAPPRGYLTSPLLPYFSMIFNRLSRVVRK